MNDLSNDKIFEKITDILTKRYVCFICVALAASITGILLEGIQMARWLHAIIAGLTCGIITLVIYLALASITLIVLYLPKAVKWKGSIHRLEYFLVLLATDIMYGLVNFIYAPERYGLEYKTNNFMFIIGTIIAFFLIYIEVCACIKRLNDLKWSKLLAIIHIIPFVTLSIRIPCLFIKGKSVKIDNNEIMQNIEKNESKELFEKVTDDLLNNKITIEDAINTIAENDKTINDEIQKSTFNDIIQDSDKLTEIFKNISKND